MNVEPQMVMHWMKCGGVDVHIVELDRVLSGEELRSASEGLDIGVEFLYCVGDGLVVLEVVLDDEPKQFCLGVVFGVVLPM